MTKSKDQLLKRKAEITGTKRWYNKIKAANYLGGHCKICNTNNIAHLTFNHINPEIKDYGISRLLRNTWSLTMEQELDKCELLCANCHREHHYIADDTQSRLRKTKSTFVDYKNKECKKCGYNKCHASLTFHHLDRSTKIFELNRNRKLFLNIDEITSDVLNELDKCELLCANCHMEEEITFDINYVIDNYNEIGKRYISNKVDRDTIYDMYFNKGMKQHEIRKKLNVAKSTISGIIKELSARRTVI